MREQCCAHHIAVPVYRVGCPQYGDNRTAIGMGCARGFPKRISQFQPVFRLRALIAIRARITAVQDGAKAIFGHILWRDRRDIGHDELSDFLLHTHLTHDLSDPGFDFLVLFRSRSAAR